MKAVTVAAWGSDPQYTPDAPQPPSPISPDTIQLKVLASGLAQLVRSQASGSHYTTAHTPIPYIPGADGVGIDPATGQLVYFNSINTGGGFAEFINVPRRATFPIPLAADASDEVKKKAATTIASLMNPAMSSWMALTTRTANLQPGFTVLIIGVTSLSGRIAISLARSLGAGKIIGVARSKAQMAGLDLDASIVLADPVESTDFASVFKEHTIHVVLDYIYGPAVVHFFNSLPSNPLTAHEHEVQYVQIGSLGGQEASIPSAVLRSKSLVLKGSGPGSWSVTKNVAEQYPRLLQKLVEGVGEYDVQEKGLEDVKEVWASKKRTVFVM